MALNGNAQIKNALFYILILSIGTIALPCCARRTGSLPVVPHDKSAGPNACERKKAYKLYELARERNPGLRWDSCLATLAFMRARRMAIRHYFSHRDPKTGRNPVWNLISRCIPPAHEWYMGENLVEGNDTAEGLHMTLMESPPHRRNILNKHFNHVGVGCYGEICSELFAGF